MGKSEKNLAARIAAAGLALALALPLGGCGEEPYTLTEKEEGVIVNYSAHIVAKFNSYQNEGLRYVNVGELDEETEEPETEAVEAEPEEDGTEAAGNGAVQAGGEEKKETNSAQTATLQELFGAEGLEVSYVGARLSPDYIEDNYYALDADAGKVFLIVGIDVTNTGTEPLEVDYLAMSPQFTAEVNGTETSGAEATFLTSDFAMLEATLSGGETKEAVLLFQVPETLTSVDALSLLVSMNGGSYQINLENM